MISQTFSKNVICVQWKLRCKFLNLKFCTELYHAKNDHKIINSTSYKMCKEEKVDDMTLLSAMVWITSRMYLKTGGIEQQNTKFN